MKNRWQRGDRGLLGEGGKSAIVDVEKQMSSIKYEADDHTKTDLHVVGAIHMLTNLHSTLMVISQMISCTLGIGTRLWNAGPEVTHASESVVTWRIY